jgi:hypothetical protein
MNAAEPGEVLWAGEGCPEDEAVMVLFLTFDWVAELFNSKHADLVGMFFDLPDDMQNRFQAVCEADPIFASWHRFSQSWTKFGGLYNQMVTQPNFPLDDPGRTKFISLEKSFTESALAFDALASTFRAASIPLRRREAAAKAVWNLEAICGPDGRIIAGPPAA